MPIAIAIAVAIAVAIAICTAVGLVDEWQKLAQRLQILYHKPCIACTQLISLPVKLQCWSHALVGTLQNDPFLQSRTAV